MEREIHYYSHLSFFWRKNNYIKIYRQFKKSPNKLFHVSHKIYKLVVDHNIKLYAEKNIEIRDPKKLPGVVDFTRIFSNHLVAGNHQKKKILYGEDKILSKFFVQEIFSWEENNYRTQWNGKKYTGTLLKYLISRGFYIKGKIPEAFEIIVESNPASTLRYMIDHGLRFLANENVRAIFDIYDFHIHINIYDIHIMEKKAESNTTKWILKHVDPEKWKEMIKGFESRISHLTVKDEN
jgi:hypothetical protein